MCTFEQLGRTQVLAVLEPAALEKLLPEWRKVRALRHGMAGAPGLEIWGPYEQADEIRNEGALLTGNEPEDWASGYAFEVIEAMAERMSLARHVAALEQVLAAAAPAMAG